MWAKYVLLVIGGAIAATTAWSLGTALVQGRVYMGRSGMKWLRKEDDPRRFRLNLILNVVILPAGLWMIALALGWL